MLIEKGCESEWWLGGTLLNFMILCQGEAVLCCTNSVVQNIQDEGTPRESKQNKKKAKMA
jgi:hypothetical protein